MTKQIINIGSQANDRSGDPLRTAFDKINQNFTELYTTASLDIQIPVQTGNVGKYLTTNGSELSWATVAGGGGATDRLTSPDGDQIVTLDNTGKLTLPSVGGEIATPSGGTGSKNIDIYTNGWAGGGVEVYLAHNDGVYIYTDNGTYSWRFNNTGELAYPNSALQRDTATVACPGNASTVVYTASGQYQHTIKLLIQVEGFEGTGPMNGFDTQACEMIIAKSFRGDDVASTVYGVVHTSVAPLATFTSQWNVTANRVEVLCTTPNANMVSVRIFATEITTSD